MKNRKFFIIVGDDALGVPLNGSYILLCEVIFALLQVIFSAKVIFACQQVVL